LKREIREVLITSIAMQTIKVQCACGQKYTFEVEPVNGRMPFPVNCPACGADGTEEANRLLAQSADKPSAFRENRMPSLSSVVIRPSCKPVSGNGDDSNPDLPASHQQLTAEEAKSGAWASNPGRLRPDWKQVLRAWPAYWQVPLVIVVVSLLGGWLLHPWLLVGLALAAWSGWDGYKGITTLLMNGDVCAGIVISERPARVSVLANLSATGENHPVVKIVEQPILKTATGPLRAGTRAALVAFYRGPLTPTGDWQNFGPMMINTLVSNPAEIQRVLDSIPQEDWNYLDNYATRLPSQDEGLYAMWGPQPSLIEIVSKGEKRGFRAALVLFAGIGIMVAITLIVFYLDRNGRNAIATQPSRNILRPAPAPAFNHAFPNGGPQPGPVNTGKTGFAGIAVGDKVEVLDIRSGNWAAAVVMEFDGFRFRVHYDDGKTPDQWLTRGQLRPRR
jgi:hypothetical protein